MQKTKNGIFAFLCIFGSSLLFAQEAQQPNPTNATNNQNLAQQLVVANNLYRNRRNFNFRDVYKRRPIGQQFSQSQQPIVRNQSQFMPSQVQNNQMPVDNQQVQNVNNSGMQQQSQVVNQNQQQIVGNQSQMLQQQHMSNPQFNNQGSACPTCKQAVNNFGNNNIQNNLQQVQNKKKLPVKKSIGFGDRIKRRFK